MKRTSVRLAVLIALGGSLAPAGSARATTRDPRLERAEQVAPFGHLYRAVRGKTPLPVFMAFSADQGWMNLLGSEGRMELLPGQRLRLGGGNVARVFHWRRLPVPPAADFRFRLELTLKNAPGEKLILESPSRAGTASVKGSFCLQEGTGRWRFSGVRSETWTFDGRGNATMSAGESVSAPGYTGYVDTGVVPGYYRVDLGVLYALIKAPGLRIFSIQRNRTGQVTALVSGKLRYLPCG